MATAGSTSLNTRLVKTWLKNSSSVVTPITSCALSHTPGMTSWKIVRSFDCAGSPSSTFRAADSGIFMLSNRAWAGALFR